MNHSLDDEDEMKALLQDYGLMNLCISMIYRWLQKLGFTYQPRKKGYYVDGHKKEQTVKYRYTFINTYFNYEFGTARWIQITEERATELKEQGELPKNSGYRYNHPEMGEPMVKYHVNTHELFQERVKETRMGGNRSVRYPMEGFSLC
jgi:hypothetical protein